jgi:hypothetical protein
VATESVSLALLPSPLLGPAVWAPVATRLAEHGWHVLVPRPYGKVTSPEDVLDRLAADLPLNEPLVLVPHSNAGLYVAALTAARNVHGVVFVDAGLPSNAPTTPTAPGPFREFLGTLARSDGLLPPWSRWWSEEDLAGAFPNQAAREAVEAQETRLPLAYFDATVPTPPGWQDRPVGYLAFGDTYATERDEAERRGWPVERLDGEHLHQLVDPEAVATALERLLTRLGV